MHTPKNSKHFKEYINENGVKCYILSTRIAPLQKAMYFVGSGASDDGRYLWLCCAYPPRTGFSMAVIDFLTDEIHHFPETHLGIGVGWMVDGKTGNLYWISSGMFFYSEGLYMRTPNPKDKPIKLAAIPAKISKYGVLYGATHLTFTPDRKEILADIQTQNGSFVGTFNLGDGSFQQWYSSPYGIFINHAQMNPADNDLCMCANEFFTDYRNGGAAIAPPLTEEGIYPRLQLIRRDGSREIRKALNNMATHEWWSADGKSLYYCDPFKEQILRDDTDKYNPEVIFTNPYKGEYACNHAYCTADGKYFAMCGFFNEGDIVWYYGGKTYVRFWNNESKKLIDIVSLNPVVDGWTPENQSPYQIDPMPRFVAKDKWITFTTTVDGRADLALAETEQLVEMTR